MSDVTSRLAGLSPEKRALLMQQLARQAATSPKQEIGRRARPERLPLSFPQQRLWILDQLEPGSAAYNVPLSMWLHGALDVRHLERALAEIVRRHESLRTVFAIIIQHGEGVADALQARATPVVRPDDDPRAETGVSPAEH